MNGRKILWMGGKLCMCGKGAYTIGAGAEAKKKNIHAAHNFDMVCNC